MNDRAPYQDELRQAERDARAAAVFFDTPDGGPSRAELARDEAEAKREVER